ncbi:hypothetical protein RQP46_003049 [Phenoliferia psychrophenolica]
MRPSLRLTFLGLVGISQAHSQVHFEDAPVAVTSVSLVDLLAASANHTLLLKAIQRARLVPFLNRLNGSTLFAPSDAAIQAERASETAAAAAGGVGSHDAVWTYALADNNDDASDSDDLGRGSPVPPHDNLQLALRDTLLYHILNYTLFPAPNASTNASAPSAFLALSDLPTLEETMYYPALSSFNKSFPVPPTLPGSPPDDPDPDQPRREEGLLRGEGQRLRVIKKGKAAELWVGGDWRGEGGIKAIDGTLAYAKNGALVVLDGILKRPVDLSKQIRTNPNLSTLASLLPTALLDYISTAAHLTLFAPTNDAWGSLSELEMRYLRSGFAEMDITEIFGDATSKDGAGKGKVGYLQKLVGINGTETSTVTSMLGAPLSVSSGPDGVAVNGTLVETGDVLAENGVIHIVPSLLLPSGSLSLTAEKYLIALNATRFVALLRSVNLSYLVQIPSGEPSILTDLTLGEPDVPTTPKRKAYTILAPTDSVIDAARHLPSFFRSQREDHDMHGEMLKGLPDPGSPALKELLQYHIVSGKWTTADLEDGMLVGTELRGDNLKGARQKLAVSVQLAETSSGDHGGMWGMGGKLPGRLPGVVGFGGASVVADPVGESIIYLISSVLEPPASVVNTAVSDLRLSTFVASIYAASLDQILSSAPAVTYLIPDNGAFTSLGLVMSYLLLPTSRTELRSVVEYHAIDELVYLDDFPVGGSRRYPTLAGAEIYLERPAFNSSVTAHGPTIGGLPANGETRDARVTEGDILTSTGVLHIVDQVELPPDLNIGIAKLLRGAKANTMVDLVRAVNMSWVLEGKAPPESFLDGTDALEFGALGLGGKKPKKGKRPKRKAPSDRAYTILCPTDKAFSRLNLTAYLSNPVSLLELVKLHIIPTNAFAPLSADGRPLVLADEIVYPTLLDVNEGGDSQYGSVAFRRWGDDGWLVGIKSARGTNGESDSARVVAYGRATPSFLGGDDGGSPRLAASGGVLTIDSVLLPYQPGWLRRYGWIVALVVIGTSVALCIGLLFWKMWKGKKIAYERLEGEED